MELIIITKNSNNNNISVFRVARWTLACLIVFISFAFVFGVGIASATEVFNQTSYFSGGGTLSENIVYGGGVAPPTTTGLEGKIRNISNNFDNSKFISKITLPNTYADVIGSTRTLTLTSANNGINQNYTYFTSTVGGLDYAYGYIGWERTTGNNYNYVLNFDYVYPSTATTLTGKQEIVLNYDENVYSGIIDAGNYQGTDTTPTYNYVAWRTVITSSTKQPAWGLGVSQVVYTFEPIITQIFNTNGDTFGLYTADKGSYMFTVNLTNSTGYVLYNLASTSDVSQTVDYSNGLVSRIYSNDAFLWYNYTIADETGMIIIPTPPIPPIPINPETGVGIQFDQESYNVGDIANISWIRTDPTPISLQDFVVLVKPDGTQLELVSSPADTGFTKMLMSELGTYSVVFKRCSWFCLLEYTLASDTALVAAISEQPSYVLAPAQVGVGQSFNVTYLIGWTKTAGSTVWLRDYSWNDATNSYDSTYQPWALSGSKGIETNQSMLVTKAGKHMLKICDVLLGCKASTILEAFFNGSEVTTNISFSNITIDKTSYSYGETMLVKVAVDNYNWSDKQIVVEYEDYDEGIIQNQQYIQNQIESFPLYVSDLTFLGSGESRLRLTGKNSSGNYILAFMNFTLSSVDSEGYGLSVLGDTNCIKDTVQITVIVPAGEIGNLTISSDDAKYNKAYTVNGTKTISYKYQIAGTYYFTLNVNGEAKRVIIKLVSSTGVCVQVTPTPTYPGVNGTWTSTQENIASTCSFWDGWVRTIFGSQGVNDVTRLQLALFFIGAMMFLGMIASRGNFGVAVCLGFIPYAFFAYLSLSSPCGQYMPLWVTIFIALIVCIKMKWF